MRADNTQLDFAKRLGLSQQSYARYESGKVLPGLEQIHHICCTLSVSANWLLGLPEEDKIAKTKTGGLRSNVRQIHSLAEKMMNKSNELLSLTEEMEGAL